MKVTTIALFLGSVLVTAATLSLIDLVYTGLSRDGIKLIGALTFWVAGWSWYRSMAMWTFRSHLLRGAGGTLIVGAVYFLLGLVGR